MAQNSSKKVGELQAKLANSDEAKQKMVDDKIKLLEQLGSLEGQLAIYKLKEEDDRRTL